MKNKISNILLVIMLTVGLFLLLYPTVSDYWNSFHQTNAITNYQEAIKTIDQDLYDHLINDANEYNEELSKTGNKWILSDLEKIKYNSLLNISNQGVIGHIEIPSIKCELPIYHGTDEAILQVAIGHIEGTSLPIGGKNTHSVLSGHRGLPSARLFTDLDKLVISDTFMIHVLNSVYTYEVDQIHIVLPNEFDLLTIEEDQDLVTLITCTPYGVNSHRLLVRGHRIENAKEQVYISADAFQIDPTIIAPILAIPMLFLLLILLLLPKKKKVNVDKMDNDKIKELFK